MTSRILLERMMPLFFAERIPSMTDEEVRGQIIRLLVVGRFVDPCESPHWRN